MTKRNNAMEFYRFLFSQIIVLFHMVTNAPFRPKPFISGNLAVEFFFILSGFFLAANARKTHTSQNGGIEAALTDNIVYTKQRFIRLYPHYLLSVLLYASVRLFVFRNMKLGNWLQSGITELLMLQSVDQSSYLTSIFWFPSALLVSSFIVSFLMRWKPDLCTRFLFPLSAMAILSVLMNTNGGIYSTKTYHLVFSDALWRAIAGVMIGCICHDIVQNLPKSKQENKHPVLFSLLEISLLTAAVLLMYHPQFPHKGYLMILLFSTFIIIVFCQQSTLSRILNTKFSAYLGKISYAIYLNHVIVHSIINKYYPYTTVQEFFSAALVCIVITIVLSMLTTCIIDKICKPVRFRPANAK